MSFPFDPETAAVPEPPPRVDLRGAQVGGSVVTGDLTMTGGSTFVGGDQTTVNKE
jgi:hypothetical protein